MNEFDVITAIATGIVAVIGSYHAIPPVVNWIKSRLNLDGGWARMMTLTVVVVFTAAKMIVDGLITPESLEAANVVTTVLAVWLASQEGYRESQQTDDPHKTRELPPVDG